MDRPRGLSPRVDEGLRPAFNFMREPDEPIRDDIVEAMSGVPTVRNRRADDPLLKSMLGRREQ